MRILIIARPFVFHGGVERATAGLVGALVEHGYDVHLLSPGHGPSPVGVTVHRLRLPPLPSGPRALALALVSKIAVARRHWDVIQSHERTLCQDIYRAGEGCHRGYLAARGQDHSRGLYHRIVLALERRLLTSTPRIVAIARMGKSEIERLYGVPSGRVVVIYNGVDLERFHPRNRLRHRTTAREEIGILADAWLALFVGSGFERKGLRTAIEALTALGDPAARLVVVGRGDATAYRVLAERLGVAPQIVWLGPRPDVERWYGAADIVVLPSRYEPFGNVHLEALASGLPVITTTRAGGAEIIDERRNGAVVDPLDARSIAAALERFRAESIGTVTDAARRAAEPFTFAAQVADFTRLYRERAPGVRDSP